ncbi:MAG: deoxyguanosinetriphosphate triphosphohydrolase [Planctomycetes bacterium]|nr:deoxyguanosinetriphosphate triphosphohydrolase [Planctomycetota bacterium]
MAPIYPIIDSAASGEREAAHLAPYAMRSAESRGRLHDEPETGYRTCFQHDRDRIVHSKAFRRLEYKTQVFVNHEGDHYRTRLTHTLEVAQISRSIARSLGLNEDLVEAISLAHDLGHPPFGHAGEDALDELMRDRGGFNHNRQSLRVIDLLEWRYPEFQGLNLCWEIRESTIKHGDFDRGRLPADFQPGWSPLLEAQLADVADSLAYDTHDIDDGLRAGFLGLEDLRSVRLWHLAEDQVRGKHPRAADHLVVARSVSLLIDRQVRDLVESTHRRLEAARIDSVERVRSHRGPLVGFSDEMQEMKRELQGFLLERLYHHYRTHRMAEKAKRFLRAMFDEYVRDPRQIPPHHQSRAEEEGVHRAVCDYLAGMTDRFCQEEYQRLFQPFERI